MVSAPASYSVVCLSVLPTWLPGIPEYTGSTDIVALQDTDCSADVVDQMGTFAATVGNET